MLLSENVDEIKNEEANMHYNNLNKIFIKINKTVNNDIEYKLIVEIFAQELKNIIITIITLLFWEFCY